DDRGAAEDLPAQGAEAQPAGRPGALSRAAGRAARRGDQARGEEQEESGGAPAPRSDQRSETPAAPPSPDHGRRRQARPARGAPAAASSWRFRPCGSTTTSPPRSTSSPSK